MSRPGARSAVAIVSSGIDDVLVARIASALASVALYGLPDDYYDRYRDRVRAITAEQILEAAQRYLHPDALQMVVVGDPTAVRAPLDGMHFGPITLYDALGRPTT